MQRLIAVLLIFFGVQAYAQDWDDFEPPPPADFGNIPPPPPPPPAPMDDFNSPSDFRPSTPGFSSSPQPSTPKIGLGAVVFKRTGKEKDLTKKNPRVEELLRQERELN